MSETIYTREQVAAMSDDEIYKLAKDDLRMKGCASMGARDLRNAVLAELQAKARLLKESNGASAKPASGASKPAAPVAAMAKPAPVTVSYPPYANEHSNLEGKTIREIRDALGEAYSIDPQATVRVNGQTADMDTRVNPGDRVEFAKPAGSKGR